MSFNDIAKEVIKRSIRSAVCIDDMFVQPYMSDQEVTDRNKELSERDKRTTELNTHIPKELYTSFREVGICDLDIYNFKSFEESWKPNYMLSNKDLLVIDWELEGKNNYKSTLKILSEAIQGINYPSTPFIIIYTYEPKERFQVIIEELVSRFHPFDNFDEHIDRLYSVIEAKFDDSFDESLTGDELDEWLSENDKKLYEYWLTLNERARKIIYNDLVKSFCTIFCVKQDLIEHAPKKLERVLKLFFEKDSLEDCLQSLFYLTIESSTDHSFNFQRINSQGIGIKINTTVLTLFSKENSEGGVKPDQVFNSFSELVSNDPHNFLSLLSLEMKDKLRDDINLISDKISSLDERAFFHHMNSYQKRSEENYKNEFYDFLINNWLDEMETYNLNNLPSIFSEIEVYSKERSYDKLNGHDIKKEIGELGLKLSTVHVEKRLEKNPTLLFGDILFENSKSEFYICITPACVCLDPKKVDNNFYFIKSKSHKPYLESKAAEKIEKEYFSIVKHDSVLRGIEWDCKPFTLYIKNNDLNNIKTYYSCEPITLEYITSSKENFTQRIANQSFNYGTSIGIDLPHI